MSADISKLSGAVKAAYISLVTSKVAPGLGVDANSCQLFAQDYKDKLQRARIVDLEISATSDAVTKEVVAALRAPFGQDDAKLPVAMTTIFERVASVKSAAYNEVKDAFEWTWTTEEAMDGLSRSAYVALVCEKLAVPCGLPADAVEAFEKQYQTKLQRAIAAAINAQVDAAEDSLVKAVFASIRAAYGMDDAKLPRSMAGLAGRVEAVAGVALEEVKAAYPWTGVTAKTGWEELPGLVRGAYVAAVAAYVAIGIGLDAQTATALEQKKSAALAQAKKNELDTTLAANDDPILAQLISNFKSDDSGLVSAFAVYTQRSEAVKADSEATVRDLLGLADGAALAGAAKDAATALSVAKLAPVCGLDANFANLKEQEFSSLISDWRKSELDADIASGEDSDGEMKKCCDEVRATLEIAAGTPLDAVALGAASALCFTRRAPRVGYDANFTQVKAQEYAAKIAEWRKVALNRTLAANEDPILAELLANFKSDDSGLVNAYAIYTQRVNAVKVSAYGEIERAHGWQWIDAAWTDATSLETKLAAMDGLSRSAYVALVVRQLAVSCGITPEMAQVYEQQYQTRLRAARVADLETTPVTDAIVKSVLSLILNTVSGDKVLPRSMEGLTKLVMPVAGVALEEVKAAYPWTGVTAKTGWEELPGLVRGAYVAAVAAYVAIGIGLDAQTATALEQKKSAALAQAKKNELDTTLAANDDPILAQLISNFKSDDSGLVSAFAVYTQRSEAVKADSEATVRDLLGLADGAALAGAAKDAATALSVAKLAPVCGLDANFANLKEQEFSSLISDWRKSELDADIASGEDSDGEMKKCCDEVRATLEIAAGTPLDAVALGAASALCFTRRAPRVGYDANFTQVKAQEYAAKIAEWRKVALNRTLAANEDPILAELLANFKSDDSGLVNAYAIYTQRVNAVKVSAYGEIERAHGWQWIDAAWTDATSLETKLAAMDGLSRSAYVALVVRQLAVSCGITPEMAQVYEQQYQTRLRAARVADLETTPVTDAIQREVLALVRNTFSGDNALPRDMKTLTDKIDGLKDMARKEVLAAHDWSFAEADFACDAAETEHPDRIFPYHVTLPKGCLLVSACYGEDGKVAQWKLRGREIHAQRRLVRIVYVKDVTDFAAWHPKAYRAFILRLVADVAKCVASDPKDRSFQEQLYRDALEEARTCDTRSSNAPDEAWGDNEIADTMLNGYARRGYDDPLVRD